MKSLVNKSLQYLAYDDCTTLFCLLDLIKSHNYWICLEKLSSMSFHLTSQICPNHPSDKNAKR